MTNKPKSVYFNHKNENDQKIMKYVARRNFTRYVKKLILEDIERKEFEKAKKEVKQKNPPERKVMGKGITKQIQPIKPYFPNQKN